MEIFRARYLLPIGASPVADGALLVDGGHIAAVGTGRELAAAHPGVAAVDFGETVILPPMTNAHTHLELTDFRNGPRRRAKPRSRATSLDWIQRLVRVRRTVGDLAVQPRRTRAFGKVWPPAPARSATSSPPWRSGRPMPAPP